MLLPSTLLFAVSLVATSLSGVLAAPPTPIASQAVDYYQYRQTNRFTCGTALQERKEWRKLSTSEKGDYIKAVKCLQAHPARDPIMPEAVSRFDEFQAFHMVMADGIHNLGQFLPWHRHYIRSYEKALRNECGYTGSFPYWDWSLDVGNNKSFSASPIWDTVTGFGGDGVVGTYTLPQTNDTIQRIFPESFRGCVRDGPFANLTLHLGPGKLATTHCLTRGHANDAAQKYLNAAAVANITEKSPTYEVFRVQLEGMPVTTDHRVHDGGHDAIGGEMSNFYSSPGEPLFYLHHANLDRIWWIWQQKLSRNIYDMSGPSTKTGPFKPATLDYVLEMGSLGPDVVTRDVMDLHSEPNCYTYI